MRAWANRVVLLPLLFAGACALKNPPEAMDIQHDALNHAPVPPAWTADGAVAGAVQTNWFDSFGDPRLRALVYETIAFNANLRVAAARVEQAAGLVKVAGGELYPAVSFLAPPGGRRR